MINHLFNVIVIVYACPQLPTVNVIQILEAIMVYIQDGDLRTATHRHPGSVCAHDSRTENGDICRGDTWNSAH